MAEPNSTCPVCGKSFYAQPSKNRIYCSRECFLQVFRFARKGPRTEHICPICGKTFTDVPSAQRTYCSVECMAIGYTKPPLCCPECGLEFHKKWHEQTFCSTSCANVNRARGLGQDIREDTAMICEQCGKPFEYRTRGDRTRRFCSRDCWYKWHRGPNHTYWEGGTDRYYGPNWGEQREKAIERDSHTCQECGTTEETLSVHHIVPRSEFGDDWEQMNALSNLITLCNPCHARLHLSLRTGG